MTTCEEIMIAVRKYEDYEDPYVNPRTIQVNSKYYGFVLRHTYRVNGIGRTIYSPYIMNRETKQLQNIDKDLIGYEKSKRPMSLVKNFIENTA